MSYAFIHATVLDGTERMKPMLDTTVLVDDKGKIVEVGPTAKVKMRGGEQIIDLQGKYLMPGLINMHVHLAGSGKIQKKQRDNEKLVRRILGNPVARGRVIDRPKAKRNARLDAGLDPLLA